MAPQAFSDFIQFPAPNSILIVDESCRMAPRSLKSTRRAWPNSAYYDSVVPLPRRWVLCRTGSIPSPAPPPRAQCPLFPAFLVVQGSKSVPIRRFANARLNHRFGFRYNLKCSSCNVSLKCPSCNVSVECRSFIVSRVGLCAWKYG